MSLTARVHPTVAEIGRAAWDSLAAPTGDPFVSFDFLDACEASGSAVPAEGWAGRHLTLEDDGRLIGALPLWLKGHSQGEYVFDHAWADAFQRAGGEYYPKLLSAVPFTPVTGPRLLVAPGEDEDAVRAGLLEAAIGLAERMGVSSLHINFPTTAEWDWLGHAGLLKRQDLQFVWRDRGFGDFEGFLAAMSSGRRKSIRRERREAQQGLDIRVLTGSDVKSEHWDAFFAFYMDTGGRKWGRPYLTRDFFARIGETMADRVALILAFDDGTPVAGALNFIGRDALYGRQWGTLIDRPFLHFELCYYRAIELALALGLSRVEAGAQGEHKLGRGYLPEPVRSAHWIAHPGLRRAVADHLEGERAAVDAEISMLRREGSPYRET